MHYFKNYVLFFFSVLKYCSLRKITNFIGLYSSYLFHRNLLKFNIKLRPAFISVEPADFCQLKCPECPVGRNGRSSGTKIDSEFFRNYIDELKRELFHVIFYLTLHPHKGKLKVLRNARSRRISAPYDGNCCKGKLSRHKASAKLYRAA